MSGLWYVKLPDGDVEPMTLDELDEAFQRGDVNERTMVLAAGSTQWAKLGELAGLDQPAAQRPMSLVDIPAMNMPTVNRGYAPMPPSMRPVSVDLDGFGDDDLSFRPAKKSKKWVFGVVVVAGVLGFAAFQGARSGVFSISKLMSSSSQATAAATMPVATPAPAPAPSPDPAPAAAPAPTASDSRFSPDQRDKLAAADKLRDLKTKLHAKAHAAAVSVHSSASHSKSGQGFTTGGNKFDPLNATIP
jgi:hypothetical protein